MKKIIFVASVYFATYFSNASANKPQPSVLETWPTLFTLAQQLKWQFPQLNQITQLLYV